jgi:hypothetical protein
MTRQFGREGTLILSQVGSADGTRVSGLRIAFNIEKSTEGGSNTARIQVWNLSEKTRAILSEKAAYVTLEAGYTGATKILATGEVTEFRHTKQGPDRITELVLQDGFSDLTKTQFAKSFPKGTEVSAVVEEIVAAFKNVKKTGVRTDFISLGKQLFTGGTFTGQAKKLIDDLLKPFNATMYVENNELHIVTENESKQALVYTLSANTGLVGSPATKTLDERTGVEFSCLLNPNIQLRHLVTLDADSVKGNYVVTKLSHVGDTHGSSWLTRIEATEQRTPELPARGGAR